MATDVEICNLALDNIGVTKKISSLNDQTKEGLACKRWYAIMRDLVLRAPWPFATSFAALSVRTDASPVYTYAYDLPDDYKYARHLVDSNRRVPYPRIPYQIVIMDGERVLVTDQPDAILEYTSDVGETIFPPEFATALSWRLAAALVQPLSIDPAKIKEALDVYRKLADEAFATGANEATHDPQPESEYIAVRG